MKVNTILLLTDGIYNYFAERFGVCSHPSSKACREKQSGTSDLQKIIECRNAARREFRKVRKSGDYTPEHIQLVAKKFLNLVRSHSKLQHASQKLNQKNAYKTMKSRCHNHFWEFSRQLLDDGSAKQVKPEFSSDEATQYFSNTYHS